MTLTLATVFGAVSYIAMTLLNLILNLIQKLGFIAYWLVLLGLLWVDFNSQIPVLSAVFTGNEGGNFFGSLVSVFTKPLFNFTISSFILFSLILFSGCGYIIWKSKTGLYNL